MARDCGSQQVELGWGRKLSLLQGRLHLALTSHGSLLGPLHPHFDTSSQVGSCHAAEHKPHIP